MRIRFRASDLGLVANKNIIRAKSKQASCAEMVLGSFVFSLVRVTQQLVFWNQKIQANVDYYHVWRRVECTSLGPGLKHLSLRRQRQMCIRDRRTRFRPSGFGQVAKILLSSAKSKQASCAEMVLG